MQDTLIGGATDFSDFIFFLEKVGLNPRGRKRDFRSAYFTVLHGTSAYFTRTSPIIHSNSRHFTHTSSYFMVLHCTSLVLQNVFEVDEASLFPAWLSPKRTSD